MKLGSNKHFPQPSPSKPNPYPKREKVKTAELFKKLLATSLINESTATMSRKHCRVASFL
jgi:hypothetical protein